MRELGHMTYKDIADTIKKEIKIKINKNYVLLNNSEDFFSLELKNIGEVDALLSFTNKNNIFDKIIKPSEEIFISREDIKFERSGSTLKIISENTSIVGNYVTTTNLSTIKSQIKKGRQIIQKKVKKRFETITSEGIWKQLD